MSTDSTEAASTKQGVRRDDPAHDLRRVLWYFAGLIAFYVGVVAVVRPGEGDIGKVALGLMFAPTVGALAVVVFAHGRIQFGRPTKHLALAFIPPAAILATTAVAAWVTDVEVQWQNLGGVLLLAPVLALSGSVSALGEEIGWRGVLWPLLRRHLGFWAAALVMLPIWWLYHLPAVLWWGYGYTRGLIAFTVGIVGFILFVGVLTERSRGIWASVLAHGAWNSIVATAYFASLSGGAIPTCSGNDCPEFSGVDYLFTGPQSLLGEFGWIAAITMLAVGVIAALWHLKHPLPGRAQAR